MSWAVLSYAFVVGMASTVNPCGAAMLPAYLTWFTRSGDVRAPSPATRVLRAIVAGLVTTAGFVVVFAAAGALVSGGLATFMNVVPEIGAAVGVVLVVIGALTAAGRHVALRLPGTSRPLGGNGRGLRAMAGFGVSYALASLGCTLPVFLAGVAGAFTRHGVADGFGAFIAYGLGMGAVLTALAVVVALVPQFKIRRLRALSGRLERPAGVLLALVGAYLVYYWISDLLGTQSSSSVIGAVDGVAGRMAGAIGSAGPLLGIGLVGLVVVALALAIVVGRRRAMTATGAVVAGGGGIGASHGVTGSLAPTLAGEAPDADVRSNRHARGWAARRLWPVGAALGLSVVLVEALVIGGVVGGSSSSTASVDSLSPAITQILSVDALSAQSIYTAPNFTLSDQHGRSVSLSSFRGKAVILSFTDNHCQELCPLYAQDVRAAVADLGSLAPRVAFVAINVNPFYPQVVDDVAFDSEHGLSNVAEWHYLTGPLPALKAVWHAYGAQPITGPADSVSHANELEFIGANGAVRAYGSYGPGSADATQWGYGLASVAEGLLGVHAQLDAHSLSPAPSTPATAAPSFSLSGLGAAGGTKVSLQSLHGRLVVLNFFASWCSACQSEAAGLASVAQHLPSKVSLVGIDINDARTSAAAFIDRYHLGYPVGFDAQGDVAAAYGVSALPTTVFISPPGRVVARHVGAITPAALTHQLAQLLAHT